METSPRRSESPFISVEEDEALRRGESAAAAEAISLEAEDGEVVEENIMIEDEPVAARPQIPPFAPVSHVHKGSRSKPSLGQVHIASGGSKPQASPEKRRMATSQMTTLPASPSAFSGSDVGAHAIRRPPRKLQQVPSPRARPHTSMDQLPYSPVSSPRSPPRSSRSRGMRESITSPLGNPPADATHATHDVLADHMRALSRASGQSADEVEEEVEFVEDELGSARAARSAPLSRPSSEARGLRVGAGHGGSDVYAEAMAGRVPLSRGSDSESLELERIAGAASNISDPAIAGFSLRAAGRGETGGGLLSSRAMTDASTPRSELDGDAIPDGDAVNEVAEEASTADGGAADGAPDAEAERPPASTSRAPSTVPTPAPSGPGPDERDALTPPANAFRPAGGELSARDGASPTSSAPSPAPSPALEPHPSHDSDGPMAAAPEEGAPPAPPAAAPAELPAPAQSPPPTADAAEASAAQADEGAASASAGDDAKAHAGAAEPAPAGEHAAPAAADSGWLCRHDTPAQHVPPPEGAPPGSPSFGLCAMTGMRPYMEDRCTVKHCAFGGGVGHFAALFDGHNGSHASACAAEHMCAVLDRQLQRPISDGRRIACTGTDVAHVLYDAFESVNGLVRQRASELLDDAEERDDFTASSVGGTTAIVCLLTRTLAHVAGVGDSRAVLSRAGRALRLTTDHKPKLPAEEERIVDSGGFVNRGRVHGILSVSRSLGDFEFAPFVLHEPNVLSLRLLPEDELLLLASDGLWDVISDQDAVRMALEKGRGPGGDPAAASQWLVDEALRRGSRDNVSVVCIFLDVDGDRPEEIAAEAPGASPGGAGGDEGRASTPPTAPAAADSPRQQPS